MDFPVADVGIPAHLETPAALVELKELRGFDAEGEEAGGSGGIRFKAIRQEGLRVGAQTGLAHRYGMIMEYMSAVEPKLNVVFSFNGFVKDGRLLMPAVIEVPNRFDRDEQNGEVRVIRNAYTIEEEARIISVVPTWREYLWQEYGYPEKPHASLLPRTDAESKAWQEAITEGWRAGVSQADTIYNDRLAMLTKAVEGRNLYKTLESKKMISPAALQAVSNRVTFNGRTMNVGEIIYTINAPGNYTSSDSWRPVWTR